MRVVLFSVVASIIVSLPSLTNAEFKNDDCKSIVAEYTALLIKQGTTEILIRDLERDLDNVAGKIAEMDATAIGMFNDLRNKYRERFKILEIDKSEIGNGNEALKRYCRKA